MFMVYMFYREFSLKETEFIVEHELNSSFIGVYPARQHWA